MYPIRQFNLDDFTHQYLETALWSSHVNLPCMEDELVDGRMIVDKYHPLHGITENDNLDAHFDIEDFTDDAIRRAITDCIKFTFQNEDDLCNEDEESAGHDFCLTRNGHGAGFWDGDYEEEKGKRLTESCESFKECNVYVNEDGTLGLE